MRCATARNERQDVRRPCAGDEARSCDVAAASSGAKTSAARRVLRDPAHPLNGVDFVEYRSDAGCAAGPTLPPRSRVPEAAAGPRRSPTPRSSAACASSACGCSTSSPIRRARCACGCLRRPRGRLLDLRPGASDHPDLDASAPRRASASRPAALPSSTAADGGRCPPEPLDEPALDYLAKDYQSFRRLLLDLIARTQSGLAASGLPGRLSASRWWSCSPMPATICATCRMRVPGRRAIFDTCLHRVSAARHARLIDYTMHDGRNAYDLRAVRLGPGARPYAARGALADAARHAHLAAADRRDRRAAGAAASVHLPISTPIQRLRARRYSRRRH